MSTTVIRNAIVAAMQGIAGIGQVHPFERFVKDQKKLLQHYMVGDKVSGWYVSRGSIREVQDSGDTNFEIMDWRIVGYRSFLDEAASELEFDLMIDSMRAKFRNDETLGGVLWQIGDDDRNNEIGLQVERLGPAMFCGVLCHEARLRLSTVSRISVGDAVINDLDLVNVKYDFAEPSTTAGPDGQVDAENNINLGGA
ncbi:MAG: hypothetical protein ACK4Q4_00745 [Rhodocyclaceae bacterium]